MKALFTWLLKSSKDPQKVSLTVKMAIIAAIPWVLQGIGITCSFGQVCLNIDATELQELAVHASNIVLAVLLIVGNVGAIYGFLRKLWRTINGQNEVLK